MLNVSSWFKKFSEPSAHDYSFFSSLGTSFCQEASHTSILIKTSLMAQPQLLHLCDPWTWPHVCQTLHQISTEWPLNK